MNSKNDISNSIIIKIQGGLGNQLFQYALGRNLSLSRNLQVRYDLSWFGAQSKRKYELDKLQTIIDLAPNHETEKLRRYQKKSWLRHPIHNLFQANSLKYVHEKNICFDSNILSIKPPAYLDGHWISEKYFFKIAAQLREEMRPKDKPTGENAKILEAIVRQEAIAVHIRRGDYIQERQTNKFHGTATIDYYQKAAQYILEKIISPVFYLFSDDLEWAKNNIHINAPIIFVSQNGVNQAHEDLRLMYSCKHFIIANSTFSWWGAWLSASSDKMIITPKKWFINQRINTKDLLPGSWIKI